MAYIYLVNSEHLRTRRKWLGWNQAKLAKELGVDPGTISRWERGTRRIPEPVARLVLTFKRKGGERETT